MNFNNKRDITTADVFASTDPGKPYETSKLKYKVMGKMQYAWEDQLKGLYKVSYNDQQLLASDRVFVVYGFKRITPGYEGIDDVDWSVKFEKELTLLQQGVWLGQFEQIQYKLNASHVLSNLQFIFKIVRGSGSVIFDRGSNTAFGFYEAQSVLQSASGSTYAMCIAPITLDPKGYCELKTKAVLRN